LILSVLFIFIARANAMTKPLLDLKGYQQKDGAITVDHDGQFADPYFALRALLTAEKEGFDIEEPAMKFIAWLLPRQKADGRFARYCQKGDKWVACERADADDILLALWTEIIQKFANHPNLPRGSKESAEKAFAYLQTHLYEKKTGIYVVFNDLRTGYFMDNIELIEAFERIAYFQNEQGDTTKAKEMQQLADNLKLAINKVFWRDKKQMYKVSTDPKEPTAGFYPEAVNQIYPWALTVPLKTDSTADNYAEWYKRWHIAKDLPKSDYAWGLIALAAFHAKADTYVKKWLTFATPLRHGARWNVLEEIIYQRLATVKEGMNQVV